MTETTLQLTDGTGIKSVNRKLRTLSKIEFTGVVEKSADGQKVFVDPFPQSAGPVIEIPSAAVDISPIEQHIIVDNESIQLSNVTVGRNALVILHMPTTINEQLILNLHRLTSTLNSSGPDFTGPVFPPPPHNPTVMSVTNRTVSTIGCYSENPYGYGYFFYRFVSPGSTESLTFELGSLIYIATLGSPDPFQPNFPGLLWNGWAGSIQEVTVPVSH